MKRTLAATATLVLLLAGCGETLTISHSETSCINPGQAVTLTTNAPAGTDISYRVQDDFGGDLTPGIPATQTDSSGKATATWQSPGNLSTTTLHFLLTAKKGSARANRDIHVVVGGSGRSC